jgi:23S rRNA pseudouridine955/2504/2580 synthase
VKAVAEVAVRHLEVDEEAAGQRLDNFLMRHLKGVPKTHVYRVIRSGEVRINKGRCSADSRLAAGDVVRVPPVRTAAPASGSTTEAFADTAPPRAFVPLWEDEHLLAIDKPAGLAVHGGSGVSFGVIEQLRRARPQARFLELVHRLDKETSGVLLLAKKRSALTGLQDQFRQRGTDKRYVALVTGEWPASRKRIDVALQKVLDAAGERRVRVVRTLSEPRANPAGSGALAKAAASGKASAASEATRALHAITLVQVARRFEGFTLLDVTIKTGRTHQIRVHLADAGHPIVGDPKYGDFALNKAMARGMGVPSLRFERMFLHARQLAFDHPAAGERVVLEAPLPPACTELLHRLTPMPDAKGP